MADPKELCYEKRGKLLVKNLQSRHFDACYCANREEALKKALEWIPTGSKVSWGGAKSCRQIGLMDAILAGDYITMDRDACKTPEEKREAFLKWLYDFEYDKLGLPQPDLVIYLDVPTDFTEKLLRGREADTNTKADIHEKDMQYLATCRKCGKKAAEFYSWTVINCVKDGAMRSIEDIHEEIYRHVKNCLEG